jgi:hypothetical protein
LAQRQLLALGDVIDHRRAPACSGVIRSRLVLISRTAAPSLATELEIVLLGDALRRRSILAVAIA